MPNKHMKLLGLKVRDKVTGYSGVAESISYDLYGCVQVVVRPPYDNKDGKGAFPEGRYLDAHRLEVLDTIPVMVVPSFDEDRGPADKPAR